MGSRLEKKSNAVRKFIDGHTFDNEDGDEYEASKFGGFPEYYRRKKLKLQNLDVELRESSKDRPPIFRGIVAHVNGYTQPSLNDLHKLIVTHGGGFMQYLDGKTAVTHIIASNLTLKKAAEFKRYRIVKPAWVVDSVQAGRLLPWHDYSVVDEGSGQKVLQLDGGNISAQANTKRIGYKDQTDASWYTSQLNATADSVASQSLEQGLPESRDGNTLARVESVGNAWQAQDEGIALTDPPPGLIQNEQQVGERQQNHWRHPPNVDLEDDLYIQGEQREEPLEYETNGARFSASPMPVGLDTSIDNGRVDQNEETSETDDAEELQAAGPTGQFGPPILQAMQDEHGNVLDQIDIDAIDTTRSVVPITLKRKDEEDMLVETKRAKMTAEEHNTVLLADPRIRKSSTLNPDFLEQYYRESRLHHLSTWKADLKSQLQAMTAEQTSSQKSRKERKPGARKYVMHVDFDSFFVAVSLKKYPQFADKPAVVAHGGGSGSEIASCNYPAREFGVSNGMWMKKAQEMCNDLKVLPYDFPAYEAASKLFYEAIMETGGLVQSVSIDEALVDISNLCLAAGSTEEHGSQERIMHSEQNEADKIARELRQKVKQQTGCAVSVGIGKNVLLAKVALRKAKPAGQHQIKPGEELNFLADLHVRSLPGVAYSIGNKLEEIGVKVVQDIRSLTKERLVSVLGPKTGDKIWNYARGIDKTEVGDQSIRKSVSAEINWGVRFERQDQAEEFVSNLCGELQKRLVKEQVRGKHLTLKIMRRAADAPLDPPKHLGHGKCDTFNKSAILGVATNEQAKIAREALSMMRSFNFSPGELRGIGVQMTKLEPLKLRGPDGDVASSQQQLLFKPKLPSSLSEATSQDKRALEDNSVAPTASKPKRVRFHPSANPPLHSGRTLDKFDPLNTSAISSPKASIPRTLSTKADPAKQSDDAIVHVETPQKAGVLDQSITVSSVVPYDNGSPSRKPLNTMGTQFILPTQVDPQVLAGLPADIRSRLIRPQRSNEEAHGGSSLKLGTSSEAVKELPAQPHLDPDVLAALPSSLRAQVTAQHPLSKRAAYQQQNLLPQPSHKDRTPQNERVLGPKFEKSGENTTISHGKIDGTLKFAQGKFTTISRGKSASYNPATSDSEEAANEMSAGVDENFLAALPSQIRQEFVEEHRRVKGKTKPILDIPKPRKRGRPPGSKNRVGVAATHIEKAEAYAGTEKREEKWDHEKNEESPEYVIYEDDDEHEEYGEYAEERSFQLVQGYEDYIEYDGYEQDAEDDKYEIQIGDDEYEEIEESGEDGEAGEIEVERFVHLPAHPENPAFTKRRLSSPKELREAMSAWWKEFKDEGPYEDDVKALKVYLGKVVEDEGDIAKAAGVIEWLAWLMDEAGPASSESGRAARDIWQGALGAMIEHIDRAVRLKGLGPVAI